MLCCPRTRLHAVTRGRPADEDCGNHPGSMHCSRLDDYAYTIRGKRQRGAQRGRHMAIEEKTLSLERFLQLPEEEPALEYVDGGVSQKVSPQVWHSRLQVA